MNLYFKYCLFILLCITISLRAQIQADRSKVITAYVNNFARYTSWPNEDQTDSFNIVLYTDNIDIINEFRRFSQTQKIKDKPVKVSVYKSKYDLTHAQIVLLTKDKSGNLIEIYNAIESKPVLLISEEYGDKQNIMINLYETPQKKLLFEINKANIINQNLTVDPEILLAGGTEIDVASLYHKSQVSLRNMQRDMSNMKDSLAYLSKNIDLSARQINEQQSELSKQKLQLEESNEKLKLYQQEILSQKEILAAQQKTLTEQKDSITYKNQVLQELMLESGDMEQFLKTKQKQIEKLNEKIGILNKEIESKNEVLGNQSIKIAHQNQLLTLSIIIAVLSLFLITSIFIIYRNNKRKKDILALKNKIINERLEDLKQLNIKLEEADQYKSIFLASMSHELRTPLNSIIGYTGILLMGMTGKLNEEQDKQLYKVKNNARHLLSLINDILDISKIEADRVELQYEELNIENLIKEIVEIIHPKVLEKGLTLSTQISDNLVISTDIRRIKQVVLNLVSNAVNYTNEGNVHIKAERRGENRFTISVKDTGIGISENEMSRLFQPFQQIDSSLTKKNKGTGLGLYLCKKLMTLLGGDIFVESEYGKGSEFYIEMPIKI